MTKNLNYFLNLHWTYLFEWSDEDNCYIASVAELEGLKTDGKTVDEAAHMIKDALIEYIETMLESGKEIPEPPKPEFFKGRVTFRTTPEKHYKLVKKATSQKKSLNKLLNEIIERNIA